MTEGNNRHLHNISRNATCEIAVAANGWVVTTRRLSRDPEIRVFTYWEDVKDHLTSQIGNDK